MAKKTAFVLLTIWLCYTQTLATKQHRSRHHSQTLKVVRQNACDDFPCTVQGTECQIRRGQAQCVCLSSCPRPQSSESFICASNGQTYYNRCFMNKAACENGIVIREVPCATTRPTTTTTRTAQVPHASNRLRRLSVRPSDSLVLHCNVTAFPPATIQWTKAGFESFLTPSTLHDVTIEEESATLTIHNAGPDHTGEYQCLAINDRGFVVIRFNVSLREENKKSSCQAISQEQIQSCSHSESHRRKFWTFDPVKKMCIRKNLHSCSNITNKYTHRSACEKSCLNSVCFLPLRQGSCFRFQSRAYFDSSTSSCRTFVYRGCHGNENNFRSIEDCERNCGVRPAWVRPSDCPLCNQNLATSYCDNDFAFAGRLLKSPDPSFPFLRVRVTAVYKDNGGVLTGADQAQDEVEAVREFQLNTNKRCPCPDPKQLQVDGGRDDVEVILSGNYRFGIPMIAQGNLGVLATTENKNRMRANIRSSTRLCILLNRLRNNSST